ncbi:N-acetylmuramoyl-L-alanine amidase [Clostridium sp. CCUG 7971]|uniref:N-acetylmuramoyl-L-alanine amidase n=1 Tax=Clostridium sp. CCUG 7971 TaxID=2811414 RepID=UPI001ABAEC92|nr:N-acetylmuramoyl-L-alanine amidase [Clostridium sp. CCUG 7971]
MRNNNEVVLDYGHGGSDSGACANGLKEKVLNYNTGKACKRELERHNVKVYETRSNDEYVSLSKRCEIANNTNAKWFVSIHHNAGGGDRGEVIHSFLKGEGLILANNISESLIDIGQTIVKVYDKKHGNRDYYYVINNTRMKSNIVEVCFIDNKEDIKIADTKEEQERNGIAIAHGILKTMGISIKGENQMKKYTNCILFSNEVDKTTAEVLAWGKTDYIIKNIKDHVEWEGFNLFTIGGGTKEEFLKLKTGEKCTFLDGKNRFETLDLVLKHLGK